MVTAGQERDQATNLPLQPRAACQCRYVCSSNSAEQPQNSHRITVDHPLLFHSC